MLIHRHSANYRDFGTLRQPPALLGKVQTTDLVERPACKLALWGASHIRWGSCPPAVSSSKEFTGRGHYTCELQPIWEFPKIGDPNIVP